MEIIKWRYMAVIFDNVIVVNSSLNHNEVIKNDCHISSFYYLCLHLLVSLRIYLEIFSLMFLVYINHKIS